MKRMRGDTSTAALRKKGKYPRGGKLLVEEGGESCDEWGRVSGIKKKCPVPLGTEKFNSRNRSNKGKVGKGSTGSKPSPVGAPWPGRPSGDQPG